MGAVGVAWVVANHDKGGFPVPSSPAEGFHHQFPGLGIYHRRGLVSQEDGGGQGQGSRHGHSLPLSAAQRVHGE